MIDVLIKNKRYTAKSNSIKNEEVLFKYNLKIYLVFNLVVNVRVVCYENVLSELTKAIEV